MCVLISQAIGPLYVAITAFGITGYVVQGVREHAEALSACCTARCPCFLAPAPHAILPSDNAWHSVCAAASKDSNWRNSPVLVSNLKIVGSCRGDDDDRRLKQLQQYAQELGLAGTQLQVQQSYTLSTCPALVDTPAFCVVALCLGLLIPTLMLQPDVSLSC